MRKILFTSLILVHSLYSEEERKMFSPNMSYHQGLILQLQETSYSLKLNLLTQNRFIYDERRGDLHNHTWNFENTLDALNISGSIAKSGYYNFRVQFGAYAKEPMIAWGYGGWELNEKYNISFGQFHLPTTREWVIQDEYQLGVSRGYLTTLLDMQGVGIQLGYRKDDMRVSGYCTMGSLEEKTNKYSANQNAWLLGARIEKVFYKEESSIFNRIDPSGQVNTKGFTPFQQFSSPKGSKKSILIGSYLSYGSVLFPKGNQKEHFAMVTFDMQANFNGFSNYNLVWLTDLNHKTAFGLLSQGGLYITDRLELYGRYEFSHHLRAKTRVENDGMISLGGNFYLKGQSFKFSGNYGYSFGSLLNQRALHQGAVTNWLDDARGKKSQQLLQFQLQNFF